MVSFAFHIIYYIHSEALLAFRIQVLGKKQESIKDIFSQSNPLSFSLGILNEVKIILVKICDLKFQQHHLSHNCIFRVIVLWYSCMHATLSDFSRGLYTFSKAEIRLGV